MTVPLSPTPPRRKAAIRFGTLLEETLKARGIGKKSLARQVGTSAGLVWQWSAGNNLPRLETALRLAEALGEPRLAGIVREARTQRCETCGTEILNEGGTPVRYCSEPCKVVRNVMRTGVPTRERAVVAERRLSLYRDAVDAYCRGCQPEGLCRDASCDLRPVSPLRLARREAPTVLSVVPDQPRTLSESHREALVRSTNRRWAREGERERTSAAVRATRASWTPEQREAWIDSIRQGRRRHAGGREG